MSKIAFRVGDRVVVRQGYDKWYAEYMKPHVPLGLYDGKHGTVKQIGSIDTALVEIDGDPGYFGMSWKFLMPEDKLETELQRVLAELPLDESHYWTIEILKHEGRHYAVSIHHGDADPNEPCAFGEDESLSAAFREAHADYQKHECSFADDLVYEDDDDA